MVTVVAIVFTDLLIGISLGLAVGVIVILYYQLPKLPLPPHGSEEGEREHVEITLAEEVTFFNKGAIRNAVR